MKIRTLRSAFLMLALLVLAPYALSAQTIPNSSFSDARQTQGNLQTIERGATPPGAAVNAITQTAVSVGILSCASRINQVSNFLGAGTQKTGAFIFAPAVPADQSIFSVSIELPAADVPLAYASASFAPNQSNGCGGLYETVVYWPLGCDKIAAQYYPGMKPLRQVYSEITVLGGATPARVFLMPAGTGCVTIKKEIVR
jgi:hypothetical protein